MFGDKLDVVIIGGSLAGLFTGIALQSLSNVSSITILERYEIEDLQDLGAGIRCNPEANAAILEYGGIPPHKYATSVTRFLFLERDGRISTEHPFSSWATTWGQLYRVFRKKFDSDPKCTYRHGCTLTGLREAEGGKVDVEFEDPSHQRQTLLADFVIGADGASSKVRSLLDAAASKRASAGYVVYRGVIPESALSSSAALIFDKAGVFSWTAASQFVSYVIPSNDAPADEAEKCINWVWYRNKSEEAFNSLMTDISGKVHQFTLPHGKMRKEEIQKIRDEAEAELPAACIEVIMKTPEPFVQVVTDSMASRASFFDGRVVLVGDGVGGQRPHTASAILQGSHHALLVRKYLEGTIDGLRLEEDAMKLSKILVQGGQELGAILMVEGPRTPASIQAYMKVYLGIQADLNTVWKETIELENSIPAQ